MEGAERAEYTHTDTERHDLTNLMEENTQIVFGHIWSTGSDWLHNSVITGECVYLTRCRLRGKVGL